MHIIRLREVLKKLNIPKINFFIVYLLILAFSLSFLIPQAKALWQSLFLSAQLRQQILNTERDWKNLDALKKKITHLSKNLDYYEKKLPRQKEIPAVLEYLSTAANRLNVRITEIKPVKKKKETEQIYYSVPILLKAECSYHALGRFINELEKADRFMKISDIKIAANPRRTDIHRVQLIIVTYVMAQE